jgi:hypothetical protein
MMAEQKGRGGKKPKYQIADIGGPDLTAQDLSTERVLNFLIRGETTAAADQVAGPADEVPAEASPAREQPPVGALEESGAASLPPPGPQGKKSLDHLFRRARAGGTAAKDLKLDLRGHEEAAPATPVAEVQTDEQGAPPAQTATQAAGEPAPEPRPSQPIAAEAVLSPATARSTPVVEPAAPAQTVEIQKITPEVAAEAPADSEELIQLVSLWKSFYRLKDGEIDALRVMYRMSHGRGSDECYVKMHKLAEMSNLTYRYCQKVARSLEQLGWITKLKDYDPSTQLGVLYRVNLRPSL